MGTPTLITKLTQTADKLDAKIEAKRKPGTNPHLSYTIGQRDSLRSIIWALNNPVYGTVTGEPLVLTSQDLREEAEEFAARQDRHAQGRADACKFAAQQMEK